ncbi:MAG TPA: M20/M25/M40 family metallo-hydrolase [Thermoanaerobaculia bacterium]|nr:M20/M25/M40 family metallo-hydrolase [Thermoanaerobaculia bacterium]
MAMSAEPVREERGSWGLVLGLVLFALALLAVLARLEPPAPRGTDTPAAEFSGARAVELLRSLAGDGSPHPSGSPANDRIRETIVAELRRLGYEPTLQEGVVCTPRGNCARLHNVVARQGGPSQGRAVLLMAHYDSVQAGPGVGDDLSGVATVLETARALKAGPPPERPVILLITDGEEIGLLGAELFVNRHPWAAEVEAVVNLEARGTSGPSLMFETIGDDALLVGRYAGAAPRPITSSLYVTIYETLPNDTDLTVFKNHKDRRYHGLNFAFIRSPAHYHTSEDTVDNLSPASLQHHGDNALAAMRALSTGSQSLASGSDAVFFDVLGFGVVRWPKGWTLAIAILALVLVVLALLASLRRRDGEPRGGRGVLFGLLGFLGAVVVTALLAVGLSMAIQGATPGLWVDGPQPEIAAFWLLALAVVVALAAAVSRRSGSAGLWSGVWIGWSVLGLALAVLAPGISYLFLVPALIAGIAGLVFPGKAAASLIPAVVAALLWMPILLPLYDGLGKPALVVIGVLAAALFTSLAPLVPDSGRLGRRLLPAAAFVLALVSAGVAFATAPYSEETPQSVSIQHYQEAGSTEARWLVRGNRPLPSALREAAKLGEKYETAYPWGPPNYRAFQAPAPRLELPAPQVSVLEDSAAGGKRRLRLLLTSNRQAPNAAILLPPEAKLESARVEGQEVPLRSSGPGMEGWTEIAMLTMRPEGVEMEVVLGAAQPLDWYVYDMSPGLPPAGDPLLKARPPSAVTFQDGDTTLIARKLRI